MLPRLISFLMFGSFALASSSLAQGDADWTRPFPPFRIVGNLYWVGSYDLATYLITTPQGHILINTGVGDTAKQIKASVEQLGFNLADTKILTATHGHFDHVAGMAELKRMTGARLIVSEQDKELLESGGRRTSASATHPGPASRPPHRQRHGEVSRYRRELRANVQSTEGHADRRLARLTRVAVQAA
jgi:metallo-beta-lactamase class B